MIALEPLGDRAFLARFDDETAAARWADAVRAAGLRGVVEVVAAYRRAAVFADFERVEPDALEGRLRAVEVPEGGPDVGRLHEIPVLYDGADLAHVAAALGMGPEEVIARHAGAEYRVFAVGFQPGFPYAGYLPPPLCGLARRADPRTRVPAGSVAMVGRQTGIYPEPSPGGWHLLGRTPLRIVDLAAGHFPIRAGHRIRFRPIGPEEFQARRGESL